MQVKSEGKGAEKRITDHTYNDEGSYDWNERNIRQGALERVSKQMLLEAVAPDAREAGDQNARHEHVDNRNEHRQRRHKKRRNQCRHEKNRPNEPPKLLETLPSPRRHHKKKIGIQTSR